MKKKYVILAMFCCLGILGWLLPTAASVPTTTSVNYRDFRPITLPGMITLTFVASETGSNDLDISFSTYVYDGANITHTIFLLTSEIVDYDWRFINDTKPYIYIDENKTLYRFDVNYSAIKVPRNPELLQAEENLTKKIEQIQNLLNLTKKLNMTIDDLNANNTNQSEIYDLLHKNFNKLNESYIQLGVNYTAQIDVNTLILNNTGKTDERNGALTEINKGLEDEIEQLENELNNPWGYVAPGATFCIGMITILGLSNYKQGKWPFKNQKETRAIEHRDSGIISSKIKDKIQKKKKEAEPKEDADLSISTEKPSIEKKATYDEAVLERHNKFGLEIA